MIKKLILITILLIGFCFLVSCGSDENQSDSNLTKIESAQTAETNSKYSFTAYDLNGVKRSSSEWMGKQPLVVNFWGTWCPPCRKEIPELVKLYKEYKPKGIEIVSLALRDSPQQVAEFASQAGMDWILLVDDRQTAIKYRVTGVPSTLFFDRNGNLTKVIDYNGLAVERFIGPRPYEVFKEAFETIL